MKADALDLDAVTRAIAGHDVVFHLAANPEARWGLERTRLDLEQSTIATYNVLEAARIAGVGRFVFSSSSTVYGNTERRCGGEDIDSSPSPSTAPARRGEALISAYVECFGLHGSIARFGNVVGGRATGAILDFCNSSRPTRSTSTCSATAPRASRTCTWKTALQASCTSSTTPRSGSAPTTWRRATGPR